MSEIYKSRLVETKKPDTKKKKMIWSYFADKEIVMQQNLLLKAVVVVLLVIILGQCSQNSKLTAKIYQEKPLPVVYVDRYKGTAELVEYNVTDAYGDERSQAEIHDFVADYIGRLHTFSRYLATANLEKVISWTVNEAQNYIKNALRLDKRYDHIQSGFTGLCDISLISIDELKTDCIRLKVDFSKKLMNGEGKMMNHSFHQAILVIKPVKRQVGNAHGLYVLEYREYEKK
jgi:hypothetical protein